ncbi:5'-3' exoribonuclease 2, partial [Cryomyces antarcticus]
TLSDQCDEQLHLIWIPYSSQRFQTHRPFRLTETGTMGVPALFRWLSQKYPKIISPVIEEQPREIEGEEVPIDTRGPNPNGEEFDNLYLDMNGIVHPCSHPEEGPPPATEEEMMLAVFEYTERVVKMVRPRKLMMIAVGM